MAVIPAEDYATEVNIMDNNDKVTTTLGLQWKRNEDASTTLTAGPFLVDPRTRERFPPLCCIGEIQMYTDPAQWLHVPTEQNIADPCSRGIGQVELAKSPLWWDGLEWLSKKKSEW